MLFKNKFMILNYFLLKCKKGNFNKLIYPNHRCLRLLGLKYYSG